MNVYRVSKTDYIDFKKKKLARLCVTRALKIGDLTRSPTCELCDIECKTNAHHIDYGKPLDVLWVCDKCHGLCHRSNHRLNPDNNRQTPIPMEWNHSDSITISLNIPIKQFMILKQESNRLNKNISSLIRNDIREKYPLESLQLEFNFEENINDKTQNVQNKDICSLEQDKISVLQSKTIEIPIIRTERNTDLPRMEGIFFEFPIRYGRNAGKLQRIAAS